MVLLNSSSAAALLLLAAAADGYVSRGGSCRGRGVTPSFLGGPAPSSSSSRGGAAVNDRASRRGVSHGPWNGALPRAAGGVELSMGFVEEFMSGR